jgi:hypothetical protein
LPTRPFGGGIGTFSIIALSYQCSAPSRKVFGKKKLKAKRVENKNFVRGANVFSKLVVSEAHRGMQCRQQEEAARIEAEQNAKAKAMEKRQAELERLKAQSQNDPEQDNPGPGTVEDEQDPDADIGVQQLGLPQDGHGQHQQDAADMWNQMGDNVGANSEHVAVTRGGAGGGRGARVARGGARAGGSSSRSRGSSTLLPSSTRPSSTLAGKPSSRDRT